jgi:hypothetical protein
MFTKNNLKKDHIVKFENSLHGKVRDTDIEIMVQTELGFVPTMSVANIPLEDFSSSLKYMGDTGVNFNISKVYGFRSDNCSYDLDNPVFDRDSAECMIQDKCDDFFENTLIDMIGKFNAPISGYNDLHIVNRKKLARFIVSELRRIKK